MDLSHWYDAQVAVIGSLLMEPERLSAQIMHRLRPEDFGDPQLRNLFRAARELFLDRSPLDAVTVVDKAGAAYDPLVRQILEATPTARNWEAYAQLVRDSAQIAKLHDLAAQILDSRDLGTARKLLDKAAGMLTDRPGRKASSYGEMVAEFIDRQQDNTPPNYIDWGIPELNRNISVSPGRFVILGADSSVGKTALALQLAYNVAAKGKRVGFYSYETARCDAIDRLLANTAGISLPSIKHKHLGKADIGRAVDEGLRSKQIPLTVVETAGYTVDELRAETLAGRYDVVFVDYVQIVPSRSSERWQAVTEVSMALHTMAQQLGVTVVALSQVTPPEKSQSGKRRPVRKGDLRESRQLINDADLILMMDLVDPEDSQSQRVLRIDKNKDGPLGQIYLDFDPVHMRFSPGKPPQSSTYREVMSKVNALRKEQETETRHKAPMREAVEGQSSFYDLADDEPLPF